MEIRNSIIWGNSGGTGGIFNGYSSAVTITHSIVQGGGFPTDGTADGSGNKTIDPIFVTAVPGASAPTTAGDYRLNSTSPAIDAGSNNYYGTGLTPNLSAITTDLDGTNRIKGGVIDMGAYEKE
jgi:hypothetical protein